MTDRSAKRSASFETYGVIVAVQDY